MKPSDFRQTAFKIFTAKRANFREEPRNAPNGEKGGCVMWFMTRRIPVAA